ncbi:MAG: 50S ribosomal protein L11 methyltransferase [Pyrinomonadaceae bacterium]
MYSLSDYGSMINDDVRTGSYWQALRRLVTPDSIVLDLGTGTGIFALLACQLGARRVYAVEPADIVEIARQIAAACGFEKRIDFIQDVSTQVQIPEKVNIIVSDLRGVLPLCGKSLLSIIDARRRFLAPGGNMIPQEDTLWMAVVAAPEVFKCVTHPWSENAFGLKMDAAQRMMANTSMKSRVTSDQFLTARQCWANLDYATVQDPNLSSEVSLDVVRSGTTHGFIVWFDSKLAEGVSFSNGPENPELIYGSAFFPMAEPVEVKPGDVIKLLLNADLVSGEYIWRWRTRIFQSGNSKEPITSLSQSTFFSLPLSKSRLHKAASTHVPVLNHDGEMRKLILSLMNGKATLGQIARAVSDEYPERFSNWVEALAEVSELSQKYAR